VALVLDPDIDGSMVSSLTLLIDAAYSVREQLSADTWQLIGDIEEELVRLRSLRPSHLMGIQAGLQHLLQALLALAGISAENMERDPVWLFLDAGRRLERTQSLVSLLRSLLVEPRSGVVEDLLLESLLKVPESLIVFRQRTRPTMHVNGALDLLVYDARNPRSLIYQPGSLRRHLEELPGSSPERQTNAEERLVLEAVGALHLTDAQRLAHIDALGARRSSARARHRPRPGGRRPRPAPRHAQADLLLARAAVFADRTDTLDARGRGRLRCGGRAPMAFEVVHTTRYRYGAPVSRCRNEAHLRPRETDRQQCLAHSVRVSPTPAT
jgi:hypothetical protein